MNFAPLLKAINTALIVSDAVRRLKGEPAPPPQETAVAPAPPPASPGGGQLEARLANVVVAALKEAFDRDHARLELERAHLEEQRRRDVARMELERAQLEEQRRRAEEALRAELRRQEADREMARLRLLAGTALVGWIASVVMFAMRPDGALLAPRIAIAGSWVLLLGSLGAAFTAQARITPHGDDAARHTPGGTAALWLLIAGLALAALSLLL